MPANKLKIELKKLIIIVYKNKKKSNISFMINTLTL